MLELSTLTIGPILQTSCPTTDSAVAYKINNASRFFEGAYKCNLRLSGRNKKAKMALPTYVRTDMWFHLSLEASQGWIQSAIKNSTCSVLAGRQQRCPT